MTTRPVWAALVAVALAAALTLVVAPAGGAQVSQPITVVETGWWSLRPGTPLPSGSFQIAQNPSGGGDMSVAAVKFKVNVPKLTTALFVMGEGNTPLNFRNDTAGIVACRTTNDWTAATANPGLLANAPPRDCSRNIQIQRSPTLASWSADLLQFLDGKTGIVSLLFVPGKPAPGSLPITSIEDLPVQLPSLPLPAVGGVPIPPPLPAPLTYPDLPASIAFPIDLGFTLEISNIQLSAGVPDASGPLDPAGSAIGDVSSGVTDFGFNAAPPLSGTADTITGSTATAVAPDVVAAPELTSTSGPGKPWGRAWGLLLLAVIIGAAGTAIRRLLAWGGSS